MTKIKKISWQAFMIVGVVFTVITYIVLGLSGAWIQDRDGGSSEAQLGHGIVIKIQNVEDGTIYPGLGGWSQVYDSTVTDKKYAYPGDKILNQTNLLIESTTPALVRVKVAPVVQETTDGTTFTLVDLTKTYSPEDVNGVSAPSDASDLTAIKAYHDALSATIPKRASYSSDDDYNTAYAAYKAKADVWNKFLFTQMTKSIKMTNESDWTLINGWKYLNTITGNTQTPSTNEEVTVALYDEISLSLYFTAEIQQWKVSVGIQAEAIQAAHSDKIEHPWHNDVALIKTLFDGWETESCTITFDTQGGDALDPITQDSGTALTLPTPNKAGFDFVCWHLDEALTTSYNPNYMPARDVTLYAGWTMDWRSVYTTDGNGTITGLTEYGQTLTELKIPSKIGSETITAIGDSAFEDGCDLTSISLPDSVTTIGENSFNCCCNLTSFRIPEGVVSIGIGAFANCCALTSINIPNGLTEISDSAFNCCESLTSITIPSGVTTIGESAFASCCELTSINIPNGLTEILDYAFNCCESLTSITIPSGVTTIGEYAFASCDGLTSINIPSSVTTIGEQAFSYCGGVTSVVVDENNTAYKSVNNMILTKDGKKVLFGFNCSGNIPEGVTTIGSYAFNSCSGLTSITIPSGVTTIGSYAFSSCSGLTSITIPSGVTTIENQAFSYCSGVTSITIPSSVTTIGNQAFSYCSGVTSITIPSGVTTIGSYAFSTCSGLTSITISNSVTSIGKYAFMGCSSLESLTIPFVGGSETENTYLGYIFGASSYSNNSSYVPKTLKSVVVTGGSTIASYAFSGCSGLTSISIPSSVTSIGKFAFNNCNSLESLTIPFVGGSETENTYLGYIFGASSYSNNSSYVPKTLKSVVLIGGSTIVSNAFYNCSGLTSITIPSSVTTIENSAFEGCSGLTSIIIPNSVTSIGDSAFRGCSSLESLTIPFVGGSETENTYLGYIFGASSYSNNSSYVPKTLKSVVLIGGSTIVSNAFYNCSGLTSITIPSSVTTIENSAFEGCSGLTSIIIPNSVTSIGDSAFRGCSSLESLTIPFVGGSETENTYLGYIFGASSYSNNSSYVPKTLKSVVLIGGSTIVSNAFYNCSGLTSITIPSSVTTIENSAFEGCSGLTSITIPSSVTTIGNSAFRSCSGLTLITIPSSVTAIGTGAFYGCSGLTSITIPEGVKTIELAAFRNCSGLTSITIPSSVTTIGNNAFYNCSKLTSITIPSSVTTIGINAFYGCSDLTSIIIPSSVTTIGSYAFQGCSGVTSVVVDENNTEYKSVNNMILTKDGKKVLFGFNCSITIPEGVTTIGFNAFYGCSDLTSIIIPSSVTYIGSGAFSGCSGVTSVVVDENNTEYKSVNNMILTKDGKTVVQGFNCSGIIPEGVTTIGGEAFSGCSGLTSITIPSSVTTIGGEAFSGCSGLTSITIPSSVTTIGSKAFSGCSKLTSITIPSSVTTIGGEAFSGCSGLTSITIPSSVTTIGSKAFSGCSKLTSITFEDASGWYRTTSSSYTGGTSTDLSVPTTNAKYFKITYSSNYWYKQTA